MCSAETLPPSPECLSPVGEETLVQGVVSRLEPAFVEAVTRKPRAMRGQPFLVEVIIAYDCKADLAGVGESAIDPVTGVYVHRFVNRVPLLFSESGDVTIKAARDAGLSRYEIAPETRSHLFVHVAGVNIPYTSESKEAIKFVDEYYEEIRLAIQECGRKISKHIRSIKRGEEKAVMGKRKAIVHSLILRELNRYAGRKVAGPKYAAAFGFDEIMPEIVEEYGLDVFATDRAVKAAKEKAIRAKEKAEAKHAGPVAKREPGSEEGHQGEEAAAGASPGDREETRPGPGPLTGHASNGSRTISNQESPALPAVRGRGAGRRVRGHLRGRVGREAAGLREDAHVAEAGQLDHGHGPRHPEEPATDPGPGAVHHGAGRLLSGRDGPRRERAALHVQGAEGRPRLRRVRRHRRLQRVGRDLVHDHVERRPGGRHREAAVPGQPRHRDHRGQLRLHQEGLLLHAEEPVPEVPVDGHERPGRERPAHRRAGAHHPAAARERQHHRRPEGPDLRRHHPRSTRRARISPARSGSRASPASPGSGRSRSTASRP